MTNEWISSMVLNTLPLAVFVAFSIYLLRRMRTRDGRTYSEIQAQALQDQLVEARKMNQLLERVAVALESRNR
jgi:hypothetical protein